LRARRLVRLPETARCKAAVEGDLYWRILRIG